jgi:hypothetical protein
MTNSAPKDPTRVTVHSAILSYPNLFVPRRNKEDETDEGGYDCELWFYNDNPNSARMYQLLMAATQAAAAEKFGNKPPSNLKSPIRASGEKESWVGGDGFCEEQEQASRL